MSSGRPCTHRGLDLCLDCWPTKARLAHVSAPGQDFYAWSGGGHRHGQTQALDVQYKPHCLPCPYKQPARRPA